MNYINIKRTHSSDKDFSSLTAKLDHELNERYQTGQAVYDEHNKIELNHTVIIAYDKEKPVGCGCFKQFDAESIEIKRMFIITENRGKGISKLILKELEIWAKEFGFLKSILETGVKQPEAIGLYENNGYKRIMNYGQYKNLSTSVCFEKKL